MSFVVDNANVFYLLLGIVAAGLAIAWWVTKRLKYLGFAGSVLAVIGFLWLLTRFVISDAKQIEMNVHVMADSLVDRKVDDLFKHISRDFNYKGMDRAMLHQKAKAAVENHKVREVKITKFNIEKLSRSERKATARFRVSAWGEHSGNPYLFGTEADFVLEGDRWLLKTLRFYNPLVNQTEEFDLPGLR